MGYAIEKNIPSEFRSGDYVPTDSMIEFPPTAPSIDVAVLWDFLDRHGFDINVDKTSFLDRMKLGHTIEIFTLKGAMMFANAQTFRNVSQVEELLTGDWRDLYERNVPLLDQNTFCIDQTLSIA